MANMDTTSKRFSAMQVAKPYGPSLPRVDGGISFGDRMHLMWMYAFAGVVSTTTGSPAWAVVVPGNAAWAVTVPGNSAWGVTIP